MSKTSTRYHSRMLRVLNHIDGHLDEDLSLGRLSEVAHFSLFHFHRQFALLFGLSVHEYVHLVRMKRASWKLAFRTDSITEIALEARYEKAESFARAFRRHFDQAPSKFRAAPESRQWISSFDPVQQARRIVMPTPYTTSVVEILTLPDIPVLCMIHRGNPQRLDETIRRFIAWRRRVGLGAARHRTYTIFHNDPETVPPEDYRIDLAVHSASPARPDEPDLVSGVIQGGRCARLHITGSSDDLRPAALFLYRDWLPASGEELRDAPLYAERVTFFPDVPEHEAITDLYLPLR